jgi:uncharacterized protein YbaR (Trm112 family)
MKRDLTDILACPVCRGPLELVVEVEENGDVITGVLKCSHCKIDYPITEGIPNLTPPQKTS